MKNQARTCVFQRLAVLGLLLVMAEHSGAAARAGEGEPGCQAQESTGVPEEGIDPALAAVLDKAKACGVKFIRNDLFPRSQDGGKSQNYVNAAYARGIHVIGIVRSDPFMPYESHDWGVKWQEYVRTVVNENKHWVKDWQIDNELNHPLQNRFTAYNRQLRQDIVRMGVQAAFQADRNLSTTMVNLYWWGNWVENMWDITLYRDLRNELRNELRSSGVRLDMLLGLDIYRGTFYWLFDIYLAPHLDESDFSSAQNIWQGDMLMLETGYCTPFWPFTDEAQRTYLAEIYTTMNSFQAGLIQKGTPWYRGTMIIEARDNNTGLHGNPAYWCEDNFGLLKSDVTEKPAWHVFAVHNLECTGFCGLTVHSPNPLPAVSSLSPSSATAGGQADFGLTVTGSNFVASSVVQWNGSPRPTTFVSPTELQATIAPTDVAAGGTAQVTVVTPAPGGGTSTAVTFTINNPVPTLSSLFPNSATAGGPAFTLKATGSHFVSRSGVQSNGPRARTIFVAGSVVQWNGSPRPTTFVSPTELQATIAPTDVAAGGTAQVTVVTPAPGGGTSTAVTFTINNPVPTLSSLSPSNATAGQAGFGLTVTGSNFVASSVVQWNGTRRRTTFVSSTQLRAAIAPADIATAGTASVTVVSPSPGGGPSRAPTFTINAPKLGFAEPRRWPFGRADLHHQQPRAHAQLPLPEQLPEQSDGPRSVATQRYFGRAGAGVAESGRAGIDVSKEGRQVKQSAGGINAGPIRAEQRPHGEGVAEIMGARRRDPGGDGQPESRHQAVKGLADDPRGHGAAPRERKVGRLR